MDQKKFFENVVEPSSERLALFGIAHDINFDGRHFVVTHKVSKNIFTDFDMRLSRYLAAVTGAGLPMATVETRIRDTVSDRSWSPYPARHSAAVPDALATAAKLALGSETQIKARMGAWLTDDTGLERERLITSETVATFEKAMQVCRQIGGMEFLEVSADLDRVMVRPLGAKLDMLLMDLERGTVSVPTTSELAGMAWQGSLFGFDKAARQTPAVSTYLSRARHAVAVAKEDAVYSFREAAEARIMEFDGALAGRELSGYRLDSARSLVSRLQAGLGDTLLGLSEAAQLTALDWATEVRALPASKQVVDGAQPPGPTRPRLVR